MGFLANSVFNFLLVMLFLFSYYMLQSSSLLTLDTDKEALISFKSQISVDLPNSPLATWDENLSPCNWSGVSCGHLDRQPRVVGLNLSNLRMAGSVSPYLGNLSYLKSLQLQNNMLTGEIPDQLGNLVRVTDLNLSFNRIEGVIPLNISRCKDLRVLDLMQNMITGRIPRELSRLTHLQVLNLAGNQLLGDLPTSLTNLSSLVNLNLGTNKLSGSIPSELGRLVNLKFLDLTINNFTGTVPPSIYNMSSLVQLALASNSLWGNLPEAVGITLPNLLIFNFCFNNFTGKIPWSLQNLTNIKVIRMAHNHLHGGIPLGLGNLPNLEMYNIGFNSIVSVGQRGLDFLELLANSTRLNFLAIDSNFLEGEIPKSIGNLSKVLKKLYMGGNNIYGPIPSSFGSLQSLELLSLIDCSIVGEIPPEIGMLKELRVLALAGNMLSGRLPNSLGNLQLLTKLDLSNNQIIGSIPSSFGNLQNLISIDLSDNLLNASIPVELFNLPRLSSFLNLSRNHLTGPLPANIELLENVAIINISDNKLSGNIPPTIGNCRSLEQLSLARNMLSGQIPDTFGSVRGLQTLDLSSNQLSGSIPSSLQNLQSLQLLNLSANNLEGRIPSGGVFEDPSKAHLENNGNLCLGFSCNVSHRRRFTTLYIFIGVAAISSFCFVIGLIYYKQRGKKPVRDLSTDSMGQPPMLSYDELRIATGNFNDENIIGHGSIGLVYKGLVHGAAAAIKVLDTAMSQSKKTFLAECAALRRVRHRNLVKLITVCSSIDSKNEEFLALIFEFMSNGSLGDWITGKRRHTNGMGLSAIERLRLAIGIASAIDYLHNEVEEPVIHCDLKPSNVLLDSDMIPKVADFGLAKVFLCTNDNQISVSSTHALKGSIGYIPPEYGYGERPSTAGDVYSYGILLLELFTGRSPTHETFTGGLNLTSFAQRHFPDNVQQVLDAEMLQQMNNSDMPQSQSDYLIRSIFGVALTCAAQSPLERYNIREVLRKLKSVEKTVGKQA